jgi:hypothetical protein
MKKLLTLLTLGVVVALNPSTYAQALIAGWDFQTTTNGGTALNAAPGTPTNVVANFGSGTLYLDGSNGSSAWASPASTPQLTAFAGTTTNAATWGFSTNTTGAAALALANSTANGFFATFQFASAISFTNVQLSYATQGTGTGFNSQTWAYSTNASTWTPFFTNTPASSFALSGVVTSPIITALDGATNGFLRLTVSGASTSGGNNRLDNVAIVSVPEPSTVAMLGLAGLGVAGYMIRRRRRG